jgi:hypothetical protein
VRTRARALPSSVACAFHMSLFLLPDLDAWSPPKGISFGRHRAAM